MKTKHVCGLAGAIDGADGYASRVDRESALRIQQATLDEVTDCFEKDPEVNAAQHLAGAGNKQDAATMAAETERQYKQAQRLRTIKAEEHIVLELLNGGSAYISPEFRASSEPLKRWAPCFSETPISIARAER